MPATMNVFIPDPPLFQRAKLTRVRASQIQHVADEVDRLIEEGRFMLTDVLNDERGDLASLALARLHGGIEGIQTRPMRQRVVLEVTTPIVKHTSKTITIGGRQRSVQGPTLTQDIGIREYDSDAATLLLYNYGDGTTRAALWGAGARGQKIRCREVPPLALWPERGYAPSVPRDTIAVPWVLAALDAPAPTAAPAPAPAPARGKASPRTLADVAARHAG